MKVQNELENYTCGELAARIEGITGELRKAFGVDDATC